MKKLLMIITLSAILCGCMAKWNYRPVRLRQQPEGQKVTLKVLPFEDKRTGEDRMFKPEKLLMHWIPLIFYSNVMDVNHPEGRGLDMDSMTKVLPEITADELGQLFYNVELVQPDSNKKTDYTLKGYIVQTRTSKVMTAYGLSFIGTALQLFGIPGGKVKNEMKIRYELLNKKGDIVWAKTYHSGNSKALIIYKLFSNNGFAVQSRLYEKINRALIKDLGRIVTRDKRTAN